MKNVVGIEGRKFFSAGCPAQRPFAGLTGAFLRQPAVISARRRSAGDVPGAWRFGCRFAVRVLPEQSAADRLFSATGEKEAAACISFNHRAVRKGRVAVRVFVAVRAVLMPWPYEQRFAFSERASGVLSRLAQIPFEACCSEMLTHAQRYVAARYTQVKNRPQQRHRLQREYPFANASRS